MKWFFAFHEGGDPRFDDIIRVAVHSARRNTSLEAHCLYDGKPSPLTAWLEAQNVKVWSIRSRFYAAFEQRAAHLETQNNGEGGWLSVMPGAFLRLEIARFCAERHWTDSTALYTDLDILFLQDPVMHLSSRAIPRFFAVAPEAWPTQRIHMNSGVMWINLSAMQAVDARFERFVRARLRKSSTKTGTKCRIANSSTSTIRAHIAFSLTRYIVCYGKLEFRNG
jgi:hypothetical protein